MQNLAFLKSRIIRMSQHALDMAFPITCPDCGSVLDSSENPGIFCPECRKQFVSDAAVQCPCCDAMLPSGELLYSGGCYCCQREDAVLAGIVALGAYHRDPVLRDMILAMKYGDRTWYSREFGWQLAEKITGMYPDNAWDAVIAVPLHRSRLWKRGYNQAALVAGYLAKTLGIPAHNWLLSRVRRTRPQYGGRTDRQRNIRSAFSTGGICRNARLILVDDVVTTGSTAGECAAELFKAGAAEVLVAACAWVPLLKADSE
jgi:ComF family protein